MCSSDLVPSIMLLDQLSVLIAIGFSSASLGLTLFMMWITGRGETHLLSWSLALAFILLGVAYQSGLLPLTAAPASDRPW